MVDTVRMAESARLTYLTLPEQLDFLINGMEEGLTTMIGGLIMFRKDADC